MSAGLSAVEQADTARSSNATYVGYPADRLATKARLVDGNQYHVARLIQPNKNLIFRAFTPETFNLSIQNRWEPIFGDIDENSKSSGAGRAAAAIGMPISLKYFSRRVWMGTEPLDFTFTFHLDAYGDTEQDVEKPIIDLLRMSTPTRNDNGFLESPGPNMVSDANRLYFRIGKFFFLDSVVIDNVDITFYTVVSKKDGRYMSADVNVSLSTSYTPDQADILAYFQKGQNGDNSLNANNAVPEWARLAGEGARAAVESLQNDIKNEQANFNRTLNNFTSYFNTR